MFYWNVWIRYVEENEELKWLFQYEANFISQILADVSF